MSLEQFEALRDWIERRARILNWISTCPNDAPFREARLRELEEADAEAQAILVTSYP